MTEIMNENDSEVLTEQIVVQPANETPPLGAAELEANVEPASTILQSLDPAFVTIERVAGWIFTSCVLVVGIIAVLVIAFSFGLFSVVSGACLLSYLLLGGLLVWATHVLPKKAYDHAGWCLTPSGLEIRRGIWWRSQISVPLARVQHTDVHQGPLMRRYDLAKLIVHTAGTENSTVELNGLNFATAQRLRDALVENRGSLDGV